MLHLEFRIDDYKYKANAENVVKVIDIPTDVTFVPGCPLYLKGITKVNGMLVTILDYHFFLDKVPTQEIDAVILLRHKNDIVGVLVSEIYKLETNSDFYELDLSSSCE